MISVNTMVTEAGLKVGSRLFSDVYFCSIKMASKMTNELLSI